MRKRRISGWLGTVAALLALVGCGPAEGETAAEGEPRVVASILPLASLAQQIVGETGEVTVLLPPGRSPHGVELTANQVRQLARAEILVAVGGGIDPWATDAGARRDEALTLIEMHELMLETFDLEDHAPHGGHDPAHDHGHNHSHDHGHDHGPVNPHHWVDPLRVRVFVRHLGKELAAHYPAHAETLASNTASLLATIDAVDDEHRAALADVRRSELLTFHNVFDPLAERYGLRVVAHLTPIELTPGGEVTPRRLKEAVAAIERYDLPVIYAEPQFPDQAAAALRDQTGVALLRLDPLGHPRRAGYETWQAMMRSNLETLVDGQNRVE